MKAKSSQEEREAMGILDQEDPSIDPKIKDLVIGLRRWGVKTISSCQGHLGARNLYCAYPYVDCDNNDFLMVAQLLATYPFYYARYRSLGPGWVIKPMFGFMRIMPEKTGWWKLWRMQQDAIKFGKFLQQLPEDFFEKLERGEA